jgi:hypothetical protein
MRLLRLSALCGTMPRISGFLIMSSNAFRLVAGLILGIAAGLIYGWTLRPVEYINTSPDSLRADYRTDYVLMVAEAYAGDDDIELAQIRLAALGPQRPLDTVIEAIDYAVDHDFAREGLETLNQLAIALRELSPAPEIGGP